MIYSLEDKMPKVDKSVYLAPNSHVIGEVKIDSGSSVWFNAVVRGDVNFIRIGKDCNIQDNSVIHVSAEKHPTILKNSVSIAHHAVVHGATLEDFSLVGISATVMDGVVVHRYGFVAAGALVPPCFEVPEKTLVAGVPAKIIRHLEQKEIDMIHRIVNSYVKEGKKYQSNLKVLS